MNKNRKKPPNWRIENKANIFQKYIQLFKICWYFSPVFWFVWQTIKQEKRRKKSLKIAYNNKIPFKLKIKLNFLFLLGSSSFCFNVYDFRMDVVVNVEKEKKKDAPPIRTPRNGRSYSFEAYAQCTFRQKFWNVLLVGEWGSSRNGIDERSSLGVF